MNLVSKLRDLLHIKDNEFRKASKIIWGYLSENQKNAVLLIALTHDTFSKQELEKVLGTLEPITIRQDKLWGIINEIEGKYEMQEEYCNAFERFLGIFPFDIITGKTQRIAEKAACIYEQRLENKEYEKAEEFFDDMDKCMHYYRCAGNSKAIHNVFSRFSKKLQFLENESLEQSDEEDREYPAFDFESRLRAEYTEELKSR